MRGFTSVRDLGGNPFAVKKMTDTGKYPGASYLCLWTPIGQTGGHFDFRMKNDMPSNASTLCHIGSV